MSAADPRARLRARLREAALAAGYGDAVPAAEAIVVELPREAGHGDLACPLAFSLARAVRKPPREVAQAIAAGLAPGGEIEKVEVAGSGYVNVFLGSPVWRDLLGAIEREGERYGGGAALAGERVLVEFVSANPTGPLVVANARAAAFGESLCRVLAAQGATVEREYLVNDAGQQVKNLARSVEARWRQALGQEAALPADGYQGDYVLPIAAAARAQFGDAFLERPEGERLEALRAFAVDRMLAVQREDLARVGVRYDRWFHEKDLHADGRVTAALDGLVARGVTFEQDGARWFKATDHGDEKDRVLVRSDGQPTYVLPDVAYHLDKFGRGYTRVINLLGADHVVESRTLHAALSVLGAPVDRLEVVIIQFVTLVRGGEKVKMSKRSGDVVLLQELIDDVGPDVARFFFLMRSPNSHLDFDLDLAKAQSSENPVYYLQYAHARLCSLADKARERGVALADAAAIDPADLAEPEARLVLRQLARFPLIVEKAAAGRAPHLLTHEVLELAQAVHQFYTRNRVVDAESESLRRARLHLCLAARRVIANGLALLGVSAPERM